MRDTLILISAYNVGTNSMRNGGCYIQQCLDSMSPEAISNLELIDDGSTDDTTDIVLRSGYASKMDNFVRKTTNTGLRDSWIYSYMRARAAGRKYLLRTDADILFPEMDFMSVIERHFEHYPKCGAIGFTQYLHDGRLWCVGDVLAPRYKHIQVPIPKASYRQCPSVMGCFVAHRIAALDSVGGFTAPQFMRAETEDLHVRMGNLGWEIHCLPYTFVHMHGLTNPKTGEYNSPETATRISDWMWTTHRIDFYGTRNVVGADPKLSEWTDHYDPLCIY